MGAIVRGKNMPLIEWNEELELGYRPIDADHRKLAEMVNELYDYILAGSSMTLIHALFERLVSHAVTHFRREEHLMEESAYPERLDHMAAHHHLESQIKESLERFNAGERIFSLEMVQFLRDWLVIHIKTMDRNLSDYLIRETSVK
jgi:hemerythrin-like metal-binding protein